MKDILPSRLEREVLSGTQKAELQECGGPHFANTVASWSLTDCNSFVNLVSQCEFLSFRQSCHGGPSRSVQAVAGQATGILQHVAQEVPEHLRKASNG